ncbi:RHS repeat-associated core domain-containing protein, partial [Acinetobacter pittii]|uniref:RHS repeat-associated core domain-containing protein n=1 Tax=Acinetobacter pittii TaxID=48296 RepID=UPI002952D43D
EYTHYLYAGGDVLGSYVSKDKGTPPTTDLGLTAQAGVAPNSAKAAVSKTGPYRYFHSDHLTSIEVITDATGAVVERLSYDPWGKRRNADGTVASTVLKGTKDSHGFTSHEMLDSIGLVHMNGRVYDPQVGRFTSADPTIDGADNLQGYNRYSYVHNNPGTLLDPSGYSWLSKVTKKIGHAFTTVLDDWLGTCSKSRGDCNVTIGATYGANNQGVGSQNDGRTTVQPFIGFGGSNQYNQINLPAYEVGDIFGGTRGVDPNDRRLIDGYELAWERNHLLEEQGSDSDEDTTLRVIGVVNNELTAFHHTWTYGLYGSEPTSGGYVGQTAGMVAGLVTGSTEVAIARKVGKGAIWSATKAKSGVANAFGHWKKHGKEFPELLNAKQYVEATRKFLTNPPTGTLTKVRPNGEIVRYNEKTNVIGIMTKYGVPKTMFKPDPKLHGYKTNLEYFHAQ